MKKIDVKVYISKNDDQIVWEIEGHLKHILSINKNVSMFDSYVKMALNHAMTKKLINRCSEEDQKQLKFMLDNQTEIEIIKKATSEELVEVNKTWMDRIREKFKKHSQDEQ